MGEKKTKLMLNSTLVENIDFITFEGIELTSLTQNIFDSQLVSYHLMSSHVLKAGLSRTSNAEQSAVIPPSCRYLMVIGWLTILDREKISHLNRYSRKDIMLCSFLFELLSFYLQFLLCWVSYSSRIQ